MSAEDFPCYMLATLAECTASGSRESADVDSDRFGCDRTIALFLLDLGAARQPKRIMLLDDNIVPFVGWKAVMD